MTPWTTILTDLIRRTSCDLPEDVERSLRTGRAREASGSRAAAILDTILENTALARAQATPICQDTGTLTFFFDLPDDGSTRPPALEEAAREAVREATRQGWLRRNTIETIGGGSIDDNVAAGSPVCHFEFGAHPWSEVSLMQKGGGCENMSSQYSLPDEALGAGRTLDGVRKCVLHAVWNAQGQGCAPGILGVCVGADRAGGFLEAKRQLLRPLEDCAPDPRLADLERRILDEANTLGIGPMGMGGKTTLLAVKLAAQTRLPASYFVTVAYMCWACRRRTVRVAADGRAC
ncbi:MAG: fumarate hydratase [Lentisphaerae bacterium]|nr:fumarate hydratase [Lentisphaerota bacterium]